MCVTDFPVSLFLTLFPDGVSEVLGTWIEETKFWISLVFLIKASVLTCPSLQM